jgi:uncharacterized integral membrane protein
MPSARIISIVIVIAPSYLPFQHVARHFKYGFAYRCRRVYRAQRLVGFAGQKYRKITGMQGDGHRQSAIAGDKQIRLALFIVILRDAEHTGVNHLAARQHHLNIGPLLVIFGVALGGRLGMRFANIAKPAAALRLPAPVLPGA